MDVHESGVGLGLSTTTCINWKECKSHGLQEDAGLILYMEAIDGDQYTDADREFEKLVQLEIEKRKKEETDKIRF